jgi:hypothetical protein
VSTSDPEGGRSATGPLADPVAEVRRIVGRAGSEDVVLRALGGVAVAIRCPSARLPPLARPIADIDLATDRTSRERAEALLGALGYAPDREFNVLHGHRRLYFWDDANERQLDVFVDEARLCHRIGFRGRLGLDALTIPLADLLVTKLQVVETNEKDLLDICAILVDHELTEDETGIDFGHIARLAGADWGLWRTMDMVSERAEAFAAGLARFEGAPLVMERLRRLRRILDAAPKARAWKLRARIGERKRWYELPEEVR